MLIFIVYLFQVVLVRRKWQPTPVFLPGESQGRGSLVGCYLWGCTELDTTEATSSSSSSSGKESICQCRRYKRHRFDPWVGKTLWGRKWQPTPVFLPRESYGQKSLMGYSPWSCKELDMTEQISMYTNTQTNT